MIRLRTLLTLSAGFAVGYVAGTAAGRPAFERLCDRSGSIASALGLTDVAERIQVRGEGVAKAAVDLAAATARDVVDNAAAKVEEQLADAQTRLEPTPAPGVSSGA